jgi:hypothetical protein
MRAKTTDNLRVYLQPAFVICVLVLAGTGVGLSVTMKQLGIILKKEPLPLKKSLALLDQADLRPYRVVPPKLRITNDDVLEALGTEEYIQWIVEDTEQPPTSPVKRCLLFITYYPLPDRVPHVPEECWMGGGYQRLRSEEVKLRIDYPADVVIPIPAKYLVFGPKNATLWQSSIRIPNVYFFRVNGQYAGSREQARIALNKNLFGKHSYFCKVELVFNAGSIAPNKKESIGASEKLLAVILPILERKHWPDDENTNGLSQD